MKNKYLLSALVAIVLTLAISWKTTDYDVPPCFGNVGCDLNDASILGDFSYENRGYPLIYWQKSTFKTNDDAYKIVDETMTFSDTKNALINFIFWFTSAALILSVTSQKKGKKK